MARDRAPDEHNENPTVDDGGWLGAVSRLYPSFTAPQQTAIAAVLLALFLAGVVFAWQQFGPSIIAGSAYRVTAAGVVIQPPAPPWIKTDLKAEVLRDAGLSELNLLDPQVTVRVAQAFGAHSWVREVRRVSKHHPGTIVVELDYRRPAAMVEVDLAGERGLLPVDDTGVLLPPDDFSPTEAKDFPRIAVGPTVPAGPIGAPWGDPRVAGAAMIAHQLRDVWRDLRLYRIAIASPLREPLPTAEPSYDLLTRQGTRVAWGHAPGKEIPGEASAWQKTTRLAQFAAEHGPLDEQAGPTIDLRDGQQIRRDARSRSMEPGLLR